MESKSVKIKTHATDPTWFPLPWASDWGEDQYGLWMAFTLAGIRSCLRWIEPGEFMMGSPEGEAERADDENLHKVTLTEGYWLGETACTQALWEAVMGANPSRFKNPKHPVEKVSWEDCRIFLDKINRRIPGLGLTLPSEAQWEYACRAGSGTPFSFGTNILTEQANYDGDFPYVGGPKGTDRQKTVKVGSLPCNSWGLYEMHGNVREWCQDWYGSYPVEPVENPEGPDSGDARVLRGGCWINLARNCRSAYRYWFRPGYRYNLTGLRLARGQQA